MTDRHRVITGKIGESLVLAKMLEHGLEVYEATADVRKIDFVAHDPCGSFVEIQVKTRAAEKTGEWFQLHGISDVESLRKRPYFVVGVTLASEFWVFPPEIFFDPDIANISTNEKGFTDVGLDLARKRRGADQPNRERLSHLQDNWALIAERSRNP